MGAESTEGWTLDTLHVYIVSLIAIEAVKTAALDRLVQDQRDTDAEALRTASAQMDSRLDKLNDFRGALADAQATMMPRAEARLLIDSLTARLEGMQRSISALNELLVGLRASLEGQDTGADSQLHLADRNRTLFFASIAAILGVVSLYLGIHNAKSSRPPTTTTTTTVVKQGPVP